MNKDTQHTTGATETSASQTQARGNLFWRFFSRQSNAEAVITNPAKAALLDAANAVIGYLKDQRGYHNLWPFDYQDKTIITERERGLLQKQSYSNTEELAAAIQQQSYRSMQATISAWEDKQTTYEKCDLAFGFLVALPTLLKEVDNTVGEIEKLTVEADKKEGQKQLAGRVQAVLKCYLEKDAEIERKKVEQAAGRRWWQSLGTSVNDSYDSRANRHNHITDFLNCFEKSHLDKYELLFAPVINTNKAGAGSNSFMAVYQVLCKYDPFAPVVYAIIKDLRATMQIDKEGYANCFSATVYFDHFRAIYIEAAAELLLNIKYQNPRAVKTILTNVFLLETKCSTDKVKQEIAEVSFDETKSLGCVGSKNNYEVNCFNPTNGAKPIALTEWLLNNAPTRGCNREFDSLIPHPYPTVFERFTLRSLQAIEAYEETQFKYASLNLN